MAHGQLINYEPRFIPLSSLEHGTYTIISFTVFALQSGEPYLRVYLTIGYIQLPISYTWVLSPEILIRTFNGSCVVEMSYSGFDDDNCNPCLEFNVIDMQPEDPHEPHVFKTRSGEIYLLKPEPTTDWSYRA